MLWFYLLLKTITTKQNEYRLSVLIKYFLIKMKGANEAKQNEHERKNVYVASFKQTNLKRILNNVKEKNDRNQFIKTFFMKLICFGLFFNGISTTYGLNVWLQS